ncbi:M56 family metallopeptidase [Luteimonas sp. WGS1318]|uniref:M56 family metallopeptidase n=1 Tax=Luteimonas sp. WGS1318 TaxID=3366815 RepID=UPI00372D1FF5
MTIAALIDLMLPRLLAASVQGSLLVALVWALCRALPRLSAEARCWLWWLVALQLVVGLVWSSPVALPLLPAAEQMVAVPADVMTAPVVDAVVAFAPVTVDAVQIDAAAPSAWSWMFALGVLWLLGITAMIARSLQGLRRSRRLVADATPCEDRALLQALALAADAHGLRTAPDLRVSTAIASPQLIGPWRPVLLLPDGYAQSLRADELDMALTHELVHLQRRDLWLGLLPALAQHLFWFHPLAHLAAREYGLAREGACDAAVLAGQDHGAREYAQLLLRLGIASRPDAGLASASPDYTFLKRRLTMLQTTRPLSRAIALSTTLLVAAVGVLPYRVTNAAPMPPPPPAPAAIAPPAPETPPAPPAPPMPVSPAIPPAPAVPAAPPAPPVPPTPDDSDARGHVHTIRTQVRQRDSGPIRGTFTLSRTPGAESYVLLDSAHSVAMSSPDELREARAAQQGDGPMLWLRRGDARYIVRDADTVDRFRAAFDDVRDLGERQGALGERQGTIGAEQGTLGARQGEIGGRIAELALQAARSGDDASRRSALDALQAESRTLGAQMGTLARRQGALAGEQGELAKLQVDAQARAARQARAIVDEVIASGRAQRL